MTLFTASKYNKSVPNLYVTGNQISFKREVTFSDLDACSVLSVASDEIHCSKVNTTGRAFCCHFKKNLHGTTNQEKMYMLYYIYCGNYYWLSMIKTYIRKCHISETEISCSAHLLISGPLFKHGPYSLLL